MNDVFREVTHRGWGSRLKGAFSGLLFGLLFIIAAFALEWWNEGRAVHRAQDLAEGEASVVSVAEAAVRTENNGKLVHVSGKVTADRKLTEPDFNFQVAALNLSRSVEMYQWTENRDSKTKKKIGGGTETVTEYSYKKEWSSRLHDSDDFHAPDGHRNPAGMPLDDGSWTAPGGRLGGFRLDQSMLSRLGGKARFSPPAEARANDAAFKREGDEFYRGVDSGSPQVGDIRVSFSIIPEGTHSIIAQQSGSSLKPFTTSGGRELLLLRSGTVGADAMFEKAQADNTALTWLLRIGGVALMWLGFTFLFKPLVVLADVIPLAGRIVGAGTGFVSLLLAVVLSLGTIALAWLWYRPLLGLTLVGIAVVAFYFLFRRVKKAEPAMPPPPPPAAPPP
ncbi:MAG: TMEM43 family protein, partial [Xanthomonadales bacterium]|nr:TMEM43 family protein [Xanthomonadales bacterium]